MGDVTTARVDAAALLEVARQYDAVAETVDSGVRMRPEFGGATAGLAHTAAGESVRAALDECMASVRQWARAAGEVAAVLRGTTDRYVAADADAAARVG
ncbi:type VII secretion target [Mycobacterium sp. 48b]|uniref:type VII secretion target n=1 Tax=Mycobacterium sp. 48b TaxID=3400426 RepID=UPI003AB018DE